jgi:hypothetical protein
MNPEVHSRSLRTKSSAARVRSGTKETIREYSELYGRDHGQKISFFLSSTFVYLKIRRYP